MSGKNAVQDAFRKFSLEGRVIIVTGAGSGIGRAAALLFAERGASVVVAEINEANGTEVAAEIRKAGGRAGFIRTDVTQEKDAEAMVQFAVSEFGGLHGAFNNAGISGTGGPVTEMALSAWQRAVDINQNGVFLCMKYEIAHMLKHGGGSVVNTSSGAGITGSPNMPEYVTTKHAVIGLTRAAAVDFSGKGVRVNALLPGASETPMLLGTFARDPLVKSIVTSGHPIGRLADPVEIAEGAAWLLSDAASYVTGALLCVDGGYTAKSA